MTERAELQANNIVIIEVNDNFVLNIESTGVIYKVNQVCKVLCM